MNILSLFMFWTISFLTKAKEIRYHELQSNDDCQGYTVFRSPTIVRWNGAELKECRLNITKVDHEDMICWEMIPLRITHAVNEVKLETPKGFVKRWNSNSQPSRGCSSERSVTLEVNTKESVDESFTLKIYSQAKDVPLPLDIHSHYPRIVKRQADNGLIDANKAWTGAATDLAKTGTLAIGAIVGIVIGSIVLVAIIIIVIVVVCIKMKK